jgi:hypothetical protein
MARSAAHRHTCIDASCNYRAVETSRILFDFPFSDFVTPSTCFKQLAVCDMCTMGVLMIIGGTRNQVAQSNVFENKQKAYSFPGGPTLLDSSENH